MLLRRTVLALLPAITAFIMLASSCTEPITVAELTQVQFDELQSLHKNKQYFELRDALRQYEGAASLNLSFYRGVVANKFNRLDAAVEHLSEFVGDAGNETEAERLIEAYQLLGDTYFKSFRYKSAMDTFKIILDSQQASLDEEKAEDLENMLRICGALKETAPQRSTIHNDSTLQPVGRGYLPLRINEHEIQLAPDTGANLSVITRSLAVETEMLIIEAGITVTQITGGKVEAALGIADRLDLGSAVLENVVFLVFDDEHLFIPQANLQISGLIGFPVFLALGEISFHRDGSFSFAALPAAEVEENMFAEGLTPVIAGYYRGRRHAFAIDTGASDSVLYPPFLRDHEKEIAGEYPLESELMTGVGGSQEIPAYHMKNVSLRFGSAQFTFREVPVLQEFTTEDSHYFYGNIGRDVIGNFEKMTINFRSMGISFE